MAYVAIRTIYSTFFVVLIVAYVVLALAIPTFHMVQARNTVLSLISRIRRVSIAALTDGVITYVRLTNEDVVTAEVTSVGIIHPDGSVTSETVNVVLPPGKTHLVVLSSSAIGGAVFAKLSTGLVIATKAMTITGYTTASIDVSSVSPITEFVRIPFVSTPTGEPLYAEVSVKTYLIVAAVATTTIADFNWSSSEPPTTKYVSTKVSIIDTISETGSLSLAVGNLEDPDDIEVIVDAKFLRDTYAINASVKIKNPLYNKVYLLVGVAKEIFLTKYVSATASPYRAYEDFAGTDTNVTVKYIEALYTGTVDRDSLILLATKGYLGAGTSGEGVVTLVQAKVYSIAINNISRFLDTDTLTVTIPPTYIDGGQRIHLGFSFPTDTLITEYVDTHAFVKVRINSEEILTDMIG